MTTPGLSRTLPASLPTAWMGARRANSTQARHRRREWLAVLVAMGLGAGLAWAIVHEQTILAFAALAAFAFIMLTWRYPGVAVGIVFASAVVQSDVSGGGPAKFSPAEAMLSLLGVVLILRCVSERRFPEWGAIFWPCVLYMGVCVVSFLRSSMWAWFQHSGVISLIQMALYFFVAVGVFGTLPRSIRELRMSLYLLSIMGCVVSVAGLATHYTFMDSNKNGMGSLLAVSIVVVSETWLSETNPRRRTLLCGAFCLIAAGLFGSLSRGSWLGSISGLLLLGALRGQWKLMLRIGLIVAVVVTIGWHLLPEDSRTYAMGFTSDHENIRLRYVSVDIARYFWLQSPWLGSGVGLRKEYDATNIVWVTLAETGIAGALSFGLIYASYFYAVFKAQRHVRRDDPIYPLLVVGTGLLLYKLGHGMVDHYWGRGTSSVGWEGCGMSAWAIAELRRRALREKERLAQQDPWASWVNNATSARSAMAPPPAIQPSAASGAGSTS